MLAVELESSNYSVISSSIERWTLNILSLHGRRASAYRTHSEASSRRTPHNPHPHFQRTRLEVHFISFHSSSLSWTSQWNLRGLSNHAPIHTHLLMICQVSPPKSHRELLHALSQGSKADTEGARRLLASFQAIVSFRVVMIYIFPMVYSIVQHTELRTVEQMSNFFASLYNTLFNAMVRLIHAVKDLPSLFMEKNEDVSC